MQIISPKTDKTPSLTLNESLKEFSIEGICIPEDPTEFFDGLKKIVIESISNGIINKLSIYLEYFNTGSSKCLLELMYSISGNLKFRNEVIINWIYQFEDGELFESGKVFEELSLLKFEYTELTE